MNRLLYILLFVPCFSFGQTIEGVLTYDNQQQNSMAYVTILLKQNNVTVAATQTDQQGNFCFEAMPGVYSMDGYYNGEWGGVNATDALTAQMYIVGSQTLSELQQRAADVNKSGGVSSVDALFIKLRVIGMYQYFPSGDWVFTKPVFVLNNDTTINMQMLCAGDVNRSLTFNN